jgi:hypothetical protein
VTLYPDAGVEIDRSNPGSAVITSYPHAALKVVSNDSVHDIVVGKLRGLKNDKQ